MDNEFITIEPTDKNRIWALEKIIELQERQINKLSDALLKISQMSDCGSHEATIARMKEIATEALKQKRN